MWPGKPVKMPLKGVNAIVEKNAEAARLAQGRLKAQFLQFLFIIVVLSGAIYYSRVSPNADASWVSMLTYGGAVVVLYAAWEMFKLWQDREGDVVTIRAQLVSLFHAGRKEQTWDLQTDTGRIRVLNFTGQDGKPLRQQWLLCTFTVHGHLLVAATPTAEPK